ncbi:MAG: DNA polymerase III subunit alpha [Rhodospirillales bacterium]|nr:DNA polymerase III subunit alpha [Rhodospirillales bacterium]
MNAPSREPSDAAPAATAAPFVHLRVHTAYSLSEGAIRVGALATLCREHRMPAVAITDTNNLFGGMEFSGALAKVGVQPIIGCLLGVQREQSERRRMQAPQRPNEACESVVLLVQNAAGYRNLLSLLAIAHLGGGSDAEGEAAPGAGPAVPLGALAAYGGGLIALTGGPSGPVGRLLAAGQADAAEAVLQQLKAAFPNRLYVELMRHGMEVERLIEPELIALAERHGLPLVATNDVFFADRDMFEAHDALLCIAQGCHIADPERRRLTPEHHFKSAAEMAELFADLPDAVENAGLIAQRCAFMLSVVKPILPAYDPGAAESEEDQLRREARAGLERRLQAHVFAPAMTVEARDASARPYRERLTYEIGVICEMGFAGYFLIVADFIRWAREHEIPVGPGRGSGAGSLVAWALTITDLDPLRFGLLFERFLNPERVSMPDFDIDFCQDRRDEVIRHVQEKYGRDRVAQIITFGKLQARAVLRDVGRVLGLSYGQVDRICKLVPNNPANPVSLDQAINVEPQLQTMIAEDEAVARLVGIARKLEGLYRHASTHAAGVVIGDRPLQDLIPLYRDPRSDIPVTGFNMKWVECAGLVKFDFLGLKTLTVLEGAVRLVAEGEGVRLDLSNLPLSDANTFEMLGRGDTVGVFQLESAGMQNVLRKLKPDTLEDIIAVVALYRPGPMDNIDSYIDRKHGREQVDYLYPTLEPILKETYGIIIYQEQVMQIAQELAGYSLGAADLLRRAMGKKIKAEMEEQRQIFVSGAVARGVPQHRASFIFDLVNKFAGYGFNKSHAAAYAVIAYQTAYLKANHPVAFFAASMTLDLDHPDKINGFRQQLARTGIRLLPPDINASDATFAVEACAESLDGKAIRYGLAAIKNVGGGAMGAVVEDRRRGGAFADLEDFARRMGASQMNKRQLENLVRAGAFDTLDGNRRRLFEGIEGWLRAAAAMEDERTSGQLGLFGGPAAVAGSRRLQLPAVEDWPPMERLKQEFDALGFYLSAHPLHAYERVLRRRKVVAYGMLMREARAGLVVLAGTVTAKKERTSGRGNRFAVVEFSDASGVFEVLVFSELLATARPLLEAGRSLLIKATAQVEGTAIRLQAQSFEPLEDLAARTPSQFAVIIGSRQPLASIKSVLDDHRGGRGRVKLVSSLDDGREVEVALPESYAVGPAVLPALQRIPGVYEVQEL